MFDDVNGKMVELTSPSQYTFAPDAVHGLPSSFSCVPSRVIGRVCSCSSSFFSFLESMGQACTLRRTESTVIRVRDLMIADWSNVPDYEEFESRTSVGDLPSYVFPLQHSASNLPKILIRGCCRAMPS